MNIIYFHLVSFITCNIIDDLVESFENSMNNCNEILSAPKKSLKLVDKIFFFILEKNQDIPTTKDNLINTAKNDFIESAQYHYKAIKNIKIAEKIEKPQIPEKQPFEIIKEKCGDENILFNEDYEKKEKEDECIKND